MKAQHYMCLDIWGKPGGPQVIWSQAPFPTVLWVRSASQETFLMVGPGTVPASPWGMGFSCLPACRIIQTSQSYPPVGTNSHLTLLLLQSLPPTASAYSFCSGVQPPCGTEWHTVSSTPDCVYVTNKLLSISSVQHWVSYVQPYQ